MNTFLWVLQSLMAIAFIVPGVFKLIYSEEELIEKGMAGLEGFRPGEIRFIGIMEVLGAIGLIFPLFFNIFPVLTIFSAIGLAFIMIPAAVISFKRKEYNKVILNAIIFLICIFIAHGRIAEGIFVTQDKVNYQIF